MAGARFLGFFGQQSDAEVSSNFKMVEELERSGTLTSPACINAFLAVDRGAFWTENSGVTYIDMPLRSGKLHQSAPHIYARALEAMMPLRPGMSFLNIGSGTGYFSCIVAELIGNESINDGIELSPEALAHSEERCRLHGRNNIEFSLGNAYRLDVESSMKYDRIYIGACASLRAQSLYSLLEIGGILLAPFQKGHAQQLCRVVRKSEAKFEVEVLNLVHFAMLVEPTSRDTPEHSNSQEDRNARCSGGILLGVPPTFALRQRPWTFERSWTYPQTFQVVAKAVLHANRFPIDSNAPYLPPEIWQMHILPWCQRAWFDEPPIKPAPENVVGINRAVEAMRNAINNVRRVPCAALSKLWSPHNRDLNGNIGSTSEIREVAVAEIRSEGDGLGFSLLPVDEPSRTQRLEPRHVHTGPQFNWLPSCIASAQIISKLLHILDRCGTPVRAGARHVFRCWALIWTFAVRQLSVLYSGRGSSRERRGSFRILLEDET